MKKWLYLNKVLSKGRDGVIGGLKNWLTPDRVGLSQRVIEAARVQNKRVVDGNQTVQDVLNIFKEQVLSTDITYSSFGLEVHSLWGMRPVVGVGILPGLTEDQNFAVFQELERRAKMVFGEQSVETYFNAMQGYQELSIDGVVFRSQLDCLPHLGMFMDEAVRLDFTNESGRVYPQSPECFLSTGLEEGIAMPVFGNPGFFRPDQYVHFLVETEGLLSATEPRSCPLVHFKTGLQNQFFSHIQAQPQEWVRILSLLIRDYPKETVLRCLDYLEAECKLCLPLDVQGVYLDRLDFAKETINGLSQDDRKTILSMKNKEGVFRLLSLDFTQAVQEVVSKRCQGFPGFPMAQTVFLSPEQAIEKILSIRVFLSQATRQYIVLKPDLVQVLMRDLIQLGESVRLGMTFEIQPVQMVTNSALLQYTTRLIDRFLAVPSEGMGRLSLRDSKMLGDHLMSRLSSDGSCTLHDMLESLERMYLISGKELSIVRPFFVRVMDQLMTVESIDSKSSLGVFFGRLKDSLSRGGDLDLLIETEDWGKPGSLVRRVMVDLAYMTDGSCRFLREGDVSCLANVLDRRRQKGFVQSLTKDLDRLVSKLSGESLSRTAFYLCEKEFDACLKLGGSLLETPVVEGYQTKLANLKANRQAEIFEDVQVRAAKRWESFYTQWIQGSLQFDPTVDGCMSFCETTIAQLPAKCLKNDQYYAFDLELMALLRGVSSLNKPFVSDADDEGGPLSGMIQGIKRFKSKFDQYSTVVRKKRHCRELRDEWTNRLQLINTALRDLNIPFSGQKGRGPSLKELRSYFNSSSFQKEYLSIDWKSVSRQLTSLYRHYKDSTHDMKHAKKGQPHTVWNKEFFNLIGWGQWFDQPYDSISEILNKIVEIEAACRNCHEMNIRNNREVQTARKAIILFMGQFHPSLGVGKKQDLSFEACVKFCNDFSRGITILRVDSCNRLLLEYFKESVETLETWVKLCQKSPQWPFLEEQKVFELNFLSLSSRIKSLETSYQAYTNERSRLGDIDDLFYKGFLPFNIRAKKTAKGALESVMTEALDHLSLPVLEQSLALFKKGREKFDGLLGEWGGGNAAALEAFFYLKLTIQDYDRLVGRLSKEINSRNIGVLCDKTKESEDFQASWIRWLGVHLTLKAVDWKSLLKALKDYDLARDFQFETAGQLTEMLKTLNSLLERTREWLEMNRSLADQLPLYQSLALVLESFSPSRRVPFLERVLTDSKLTPGDKNSAFELCPDLRSEKIKRMVKLSHLQLLSTHFYDDLRGNDLANLLLKAVSVDSVDPHIPDLDQYWVETVAIQLPYQTKAGCEESVKALIDWEGAFTPKDLTALMGALLSVEDRLSGQSYLGLLTKLFNLELADTVPLSLVRYCALTRRMDCWPAGLKESLLMRAIKDQSLESFTTAEDFSFLNYKETFYLACVQLRQGKIQKVPPRLMGALQFFLMKECETKKVSEAAVDAMAIWGVLAISWNDTVPFSNYEVSGKILNTYLEFQLSLRLRFYLSTTFHWIADGLKKTFGSQSARGCSLSSAFVSWVPQPGFFPTISEFDERVKTQFESLDLDLLKAELSKLSKLFFDVDPFDASIKLRMSPVLAEKHKRMAVDFIKAAQRYLDLELGDTQISEWVLYQMGRVAQLHVEETFCTDSLVVANKEGVTYLSLLLKMCKRYEVDTPMYAHCIKSAGFILDQILYRSREYLRGCGLGDASLNWSLSDFLESYKRLLTEESSATIGQLDSEILKLNARLRQDLINYMVGGSEIPLEPDNDPVSVWHLYPSQNVLLMLGAIFMGVNSHTLSLDTCLQLSNTEGEAPSWFNRILHAMKWYVPPGSTGAELVAAEQGCEVSQFLTICGKNKDFQSVDELFRNLVTEDVPHSLVEDLNLSKKQKVRKKKKSKEAESSKKVAATKWVSYQINEVLSKTQDPSTWWCSIRIIATLKKYGFVNWNPIWMNVLDSKFEEIFGKALNETNQSGQMFQKGDLRDLYGLMVEMSDFSRTVKSQNPVGRLLSLAEVEAAQEKVLSTYNLEALIQLSCTIVLYTQESPSNLDELLKEQLNKRISSITDPGELVRVCKVLGGDLPMIWKDRVRQALMEQIQDWDQGLLILSHLTNRMGDDFESFVYHNSQRELEDFFDRTSPPSLDVLTGGSSNFSQQTEVVAYWYFRSVLRGERLPSALFEFVNRLPTLPLPKTLSELEDRFRLFQGLIISNILKVPEWLPPGMMRGFITRFEGEESLSARAFVSKRLEFLKSYGVLSLHRKSFEGLLGFFAYEDQADSSLPLTVSAAYAGLTYYKALEDDGFCDSFRHQPVVKRILEDLEGAIKLSLDGGSITSEELDMACWLFDFLLKNCPDLIKMPLPSFFLHGFETPFDDEDTVVVFMANRMARANAFQDKPEIYAAISGAMKKGVRAVVSRSLNKVPGSRTH